MGMISAEKLGVGLAPFPGGVLLLTPGSPESPPKIAGAVGVSGASADEDEYCALMSAHASGFLTDPPLAAISFDDP